MSKLYNVLTCYNFIDSMTSKTKTCSKYCISKPLKVLLMSHRFYRNVINLSYKVIKPKKNERSSIESRCSKKIKGK